MTQLKTYSWQGTNSLGEIIRGEVLAQTKNLAVAKLKQQTLNNIKIKRQYIFKEKLFKKKLTRTDIYYFTKQLAVLLQAGMPLVASLQLISRDQTHLSLKLLLEAILSELHSGQTLANSLMQHPKYFDTLYCQLIVAGEQSGTLELMLQQLVLYQEKMASLRKQLLHALLYPTLVIGVATTVTMLLLVFVIPQFANLLHSFNKQLPLLTQIVITISHNLQKYFLSMISIIVIFVTLLNQLIQRSTNIQQQWDHLQLNFPIVGFMLQRVLIARFSRTLAIMLHAGLPLVQALQTIAGTTNNHIYQDTVRTIAMQLNSGKQLHIAMQQASFFPTQLIHMVTLGEHSGTLENMLNKAADWYEAEIDNILHKLGILLEPCIMLILGIIIGILVIAMYLPIFQMGGNV